MDALNLKVSETVPNPLLKYVGEVSISGQSANYEIKVGNYTYAASFVPVPEFQFIIIYATDVTALKVIKKFPNQNPNPVFRVDLEGNLNYFNEASNYIIEKISAEVGARLPHEFLENILNKENKFDIEIGSKTYVFDIVKIKSSIFI